MKSQNITKLIAPRYLAGILTFLVAGCLQADDKKPAAPKAPPKAAPRSAPTGGGAKPGAAAGSAGHGPTTSSPHGITTSSPHGAATESAHGPTTASPHGATTTASPREASTTATPRGAATASPREASTTASPRGGSPAASPRESSAASGPRGTSPAAGHTPAASAGAAGRSPLSRPAPTGTKTVRTANGSEVRTRANGKPADVHVANRGMDIHHGLNGGRRVEVERADHSRVVAYRGGRGYVQHPYAYRGREFGHRTYYYNGRAYDRFYARNYYRGAYMDVYSPAYYYRPAFYGWAYNPWVSPVSYAWGWGGNPWYGYYGYYFNPYPVYPSASFWLTDYLVSASLIAAYQANAAAQAQAMNGAPPDAAALTPQVKDLISAEVQRQISLENVEAQTAAQAPADPASSGIQRMLTDNVQHVFVAGHELDVVTTDGAECAISEGDALQLTGPPPPDAPTATLSVLSAKGGQECRRGALVSVGISDLQDMQNHMRETIDQGMSELQAKQSQGGLPALPPSANAPPVKAAFAADAPGPDPTAQSEIAQQSQQADQAEKEVLSQVPADSAPAPLAPPAPVGPPPTLALGQTVDQVTAIEGQATKIIDKGPTKTYVFSDGMKVTFKGGKATDIQ